MNYSIDKIYRELTYDGFFSEYLPPIFTLKSGRFDMFLNPPPENCDQIEPLMFTMSRFNKANDRRKIYIPEIGGYIVLATHLKQNGTLNELIQFSINNQSSFSPIIGNNKKIFRFERSYSNHVIGEEDVSSDYVSNTIKKIKLAKGAKGVLQLDIANCFASFYTHMIPVIIMGKEAAEIEYKKSLMSPTPSIDPVYQRYRKLDEIVRKLNGNRTNGLLTGLAYSRVIIESMLARIDDELRNSNVHFSRFNDDYEIYIYDERDVDFLKTKISLILEKYYFSLNNEKTEYKSFPYYVYCNLENLANKYIDESDEEKVMEMFNAFFALESEGTKGAIRFLLKTMENKKNVNPSDIINSYLITLLNNDGRSLTKACSLLIESHKKRSLPIESVEIILKVLRISIYDNLDMEVIWLLYLLKSIGQKRIEKDILLLILEGTNDLAKIILLKEYRRQIGKTLMKVLTKNTHSWILSYELFAIGIITEAEFVQNVGIAKNITLYRKMKINRFSFYQRKSL